MRAATLLRDGCLRRPAGARDRRPGARSGRGATWPFDTAADVAAAVAEGALTTLPLHRYELDAIAAAHDAVEGGAVGEVLVDIR